MTNEKTGRIVVLNGPNLNLLGIRKPEIYGHAKLADVEKLVNETAAGHGLEVTFLQSNHEGILVDAIQAARGTADGVIINPAAFTHYSVAIHDALEAIQPMPVVEVHISNIHRREEWRNLSYISKQADVIVAGAGIYGYAMAVDYVAHRTAG
jgi:3-dehydroquinate dehydratase II